MLSDKLKFTIKGKKTELLKQTKKMKSINSSKVLDCYNINDLFTTFLLLGHKCTLQEFIEAIQENSDFITATGKRKMILVAEKSKITKNVLQEMVDKQEGVTTLPKAPVTTTIPKKISVPKFCAGTTAIDFDSDEFSDEFTTANTFKTPLQSAPNDDNLIKDKLHHLEEKLSSCAISNSSQSQRKSPIHPFDAIKNKIVASFGSGLVIPLTLFNKSYTATHGQMFDIKTQECGKVKHKHKNLKKYLLCCSEVVEIRKFYGDFVIQTTAESADLIRRRVVTFVVPKEHPRFSIYLEILMVNIFSYRTTILLPDLISLFELIYKRNLLALISGNYRVGGDVDKNALGGNRTFSSLNTPSPLTDIITFITKLKSSNIILSRSNDVINVILTPTSDEGYQPWYGQEVFLEIFKAERSISTGEDRKFDESKKINISSLEIFGIGDEVETGTIGEDGSDRISEEQKAIIQLIKLADLNIPKSVQKRKSLKTNFNNSNTDLWKYLRHSINFDDDFTFIL